MFGRRRLPPLPTPRKPRFRLGEAAMNALERRYAAWARERRLTESSHSFEGRVCARDVVVHTGLGGSSPSPPEIVVNVALAIDAPVLLTREDGDAVADRSSVDTVDPLALLRELLATNRAIRNIGVTPRFVRITFEPGTEAEAFDVALDALEERLRILRTEREAPYRG
jgi:hypothetical protein